MGDGVLTRVSPHLDLGAGADAGFGQVPRGVDAEHAGETVAEQALLGGHL
jgi:hypothetical protein